ncbi:hypothetical protein Tco_0474779 [Tanacetum coccineum]
MEFPRFWGDDVRGWLYKCEQFFRVNDVPDEHKVSLISKHIFNIALLWHELIVKIIGKDVTWLIYKHAILQRFGNVQNMQILIKEILRQTGIVVEYSDACKSLFGIMSFLSDMGEDETHFVDLFIEGLRSRIGSVVRSLNNSWEVISESCKENRNTCGDGIKVNLRKNRTLDGVVMDGEPVFVKANKECFIEMTLDPQGRMQTAREKDDLELEYWNEIVYKCMGKSKGEFISRSGAAGLGLIYSGYIRGKNVHEPGLVLEDQAGRSMALLG